MSGLCTALFDTPEGTGICEAFGDHERHGGIVTVGVFICHRCRRVINPRDDDYRQTPCRCAPDAGSGGADPKETRE